MTRLIGANGNNVAIYVIVIVDHDSIFVIIGNGNTVATGRAPICDRLW